MTATVTKLSPTLPVTKKATKHGRATKATRRQALAGAAMGGVATILVGLSLSHLAHGIELVTTSDKLEAWSMAIGIDLGFVSLELSQIMCATDKLRKAISTYTKPAIVGTLIGSAAMNAFAFASLSSGWMQYAAAALGLSIPALIYAMTRIGAALYIDTSNRS